MPLIQVKKVSFSYNGKVKALDDVSLDIHAGEHLCILGSNGSGKSTLARMLNGLLIPDEGSVEVCGMHTTDDSALDDIRADCGIVFQNPADQMVASTVEEDVAFGPLNLGLDDEEVDNRVHEALRSVGLLGFEQRSTSELSGGQQQRVAVAGALAMNSKVLVFDEATSMLDPRGRQEMMKLQRRLCNQGIAVVAITHFMAEAAHADRVFVMHEGHIIETGTPETIFANARFLERNSLTVPFAASLSVDLKELGVDVGFHVDDGQLIEALKDLFLGAETNGASTTGKEACTTRAIADEDSTAVEATVIKFDDVSFTYASKRELKQIERKIGNVNTPTSRDSEHHWGDEVDSLWALQDVSFEIDKKEITGIIGHTGSGKSTLLQLANGLLKATSGDVFVNGTRLHDRKTQAEALREVGVVFQYPERQLFAQTVFDDVAFGPRNLGLDATDVESRVVRALDVMHLDLAEIGKKSPFSLSGGQQRRVAIAGVLAMSPEVLMLDEPAAGLDPRSHRSLLDLLRKLRDKMGMTIVLVSHSMDDIAQMCDKVIALDRGHIFASGTPAEVFANVEQLNRIGLGLPHVLRYSNALGLDVCGSIPTEQELARRIAALAGSEMID